MRDYKKTIQKIKRFRVIRASRYNSESCFDEYDDILQVLLSLPYKSRLIVFLSYCEGWTNEQVAAFMGWTSIRTVQNVLYRARKELKEICEG